MTNWLKRNFDNNTYYYFVIGITLIISLVLYFTGISNIFYQLYQFNYSNINNSLITIFGILFAFIFTILTILFSLNEDSFFFQLLKKTEKNKKDIINYFTLSIISLSTVVIVGFILTITYFGDINKPSTILWLIDNITPINKILVYVLLYLVISSIINVTLLIITFLAILKK